ncbi:hypothetical protein FRZ61_32610 [Hypericibacter adhaerens]|jgi:hypothetical protein|uniref:Uncharacterized protein n=1 Tax=Hypericibacter adhaerens TaxID=2602016 RepID=A0A5J6N2W5_9PROT|nr:hypothetical protein FRZ61_32610 [Hypericibacter adhaerens]
MTARDLAQEPRRRCRSRAWSDAVAANLFLRRANTKGGLNSAASSQDKPAAAQIEDISGAFSCWMWFFHGSRS